MKLGLFPFQGNLRIIGMSVCIQMYTGDSVSPWGGGPLGQKEDGVLEREGVPVSSCLPSGGGYILAVSDVFEQSDWNVSQMPISIGRP